MAAEHSASSKLRGAIFAATPARRCAAPRDSRATFVPVALPFGPIEAAELALLRALANAPDRSTDLLAAVDAPHRYEARNPLAMPGNGDLLALLYQIEQLAELVLCFKGIGPRPFREPAVAPGGFCFAHAPPAGTQKNANFAPESS